MRYWLSIAFFRDTLSTEFWTDISLDKFSQAMNCTRRNAQLLIKRLVKDHILEWQSGVGRGHLPKAKLSLQVDDLLNNQANKLLNEHKVDAALKLINKKDRDDFLNRYVSQYKSESKNADIIKMPFYRAIQELDPLHSSRRTEQHIARYLYSNLFMFDPQSQTIRCELAHSYNFEGARLNVILRKELKFADGSSLEACDVKDHFERLMGNESPLKTLFTFIDSINVNSPLHITFTSQITQDLLLKLLAHSAMGITKVTPDGLIGSGPFFLQKQTQWLTVLNVNPYYHGLRPWIDGIEIWNIGNQAKILEFEYTITHSRHLKNQSNIDGFIEDGRWDKGSIYALFNSKRHPWMKKHRHRQWLQSLLTYMGKPMISESERLARASTMLSIPMPIEEKNLSLVKHDMAQNLPIDRPLEIITYQLERHVIIAQHIAHNLKGLGIPSHVKILEFQDFNKKSTLTNADIILSGEVFGDDTVLAWFEWLTGCLALHSVLTEKELLWLQQQIDIAASEKLDERKRLNFFDLIEKQLIEKGIYQPLFHSQEILLFSKKITTPQLLFNGWFDFNEIVI